MYRVKFFKGLTYALKLAERSWESSLSHHWFMFFSSTWSPLLSPPSSPYASAKGCTLPGPGGLLLLSPVPRLCLPSLTGSNFPYLRSKLLVSGSKLSLVPCYHMYLVVSLLDQFLVVFHRSSSGSWSRLLRIWSWVPVYIDIGTSLDVGWFQKKNNSFGDFGSSIHLPISSRKSRLHHPWLPHV